MKEGDTYPNPVSAQNTPLTTPGSGIILFGCYCASEFGPADVKEKTPGVLSSGKGWHAMITFIGR